MFDVALFYSYMVRYHDYNSHGNVSQQLIYYKSNWLTGCSNAIKISGVSRMLI